MPPLLSQPSGSTFSTAEASACAKGDWKDIRMKNFTKINRSVVLAITSALLVGVGLFAKNKHDNIKHWEYGRPMFLSDLFANPAIYSGKKVALVCYLKESMEGASVWEINPQLETDPVGSSFFKDRAVALSIKREAGWLKNTSPNFLVKGDVPYEAILAFGIFHASGYGDDQINSESPYLDLEGICPVGWELRY